MADILQGNKREGYWISGGSGPDAGFCPTPEYKTEQDNVVLVEGEPFYGLLDTERESHSTHVSGIVEMNGRRFPVWRLLGASGAGTRAYYGKPWHLGMWTPQTKACYYLETHCPDDGSKKERKALAFLQDRGLVLERVWREPIWRYAGEVSLTYAEYSQVMEMNQFLYLQDR